MAGGLGYLHGGRFQQDRVYSEQDYLLSRPGECPPGVSCASLGLGGVREDVPHPGEQPVREAIHPVRHALCGLRRGPERLLPGTSSPTL